MANRTPNQFAADRRRSHKASAKRSQSAAANMFHLRRKMIAVGANPATVSVYSQTMALTATTARKHLNYVLTGEYADFA